MMKKLFSTGIGIILPFLLHPFPVRSQDYIENPIKGNQKKDVSLWESYQKKDVFLLEQAIRTYEKIDISKNPDTLMFKAVSEVMTAALDEYCREENPTLFRDSGKFVILQPKVIVCTVADIDLETIKKRDRKNDIELRPSTFPFYNFQNLNNIQNFDYKISLNRKANYTPLVVYPYFIEKVNGMIKWLGYGQFNREHEKRADFLKKRLIILKGNTKLKLRNGKYVSTYDFNYLFYVERIVFNKARNKVLVQYSLGWANREMYLEYRKGKWEIVDSWHPVMT